MIQPAGGKHYWPIPDDIGGRAVFSGDGLYRYVLWRWWGQGFGEPESYAVFVGLNPSTADAKHDDPTVARCWRMTREWGLGAFAMLNLYAYRATSPRVLSTFHDPIGPDNDAYIRAVAADAQYVIAAWGAGEAHSERAGAVLDMLLHTGRREVHVLRLTKKKRPHHPLYLPSGLKPTLWKTTRGRADGQVVTYA